MQGTIKDSIPSLSNPKNQLIDTTAIEINWKKVTLTPESSVTEEKHQKQAKYVINQEIKEFDFGKDEIAQKSLQQYQLIYYTKQTIQKRKEKFKYQLKQKSDQIRIINYEGQIQQFLNVPKEQRQYSNICSLQFKNRKSFLKKF